MAVKRFFTVLFVFLLFGCFFCNVSSVEEKITQPDTSFGAEKESKSETIAPGPVTTGETKTSKNEEVDSENGEKLLRIKQSEGGKTMENLKNETKTGDENGEKEIIIINDDVKIEKEGAQVDEKKVEESGLDLKMLDDNNFEHLTQASSGATTGDWLVMFTKYHDCDECVKVEKKMKIVHERLKHKLNVAKVEDMPSSKLTFKRFDIKDLPIILLLHHGHKYLFEGNKSADALQQFVEVGYQTSRWETVRKPYTFLELFMEESMDELKHATYSYDSRRILKHVLKPNNFFLLHTFLEHMLLFKKNVSLIIFLCGFACGITLISFCGGIMFHLFENFKDEDDNITEACYRVPEERNERAKQE